MRFLRNPKMILNIQTLPLASCTRPYVSACVMYFIRGVISIDVKYWDIGVWESFLYDKYMFTPNLHFLHVCIVSLKYLSFN